MIMKNLKIFSQLYKINNFKLLQNKILNLNVWKFLGSIAAGGIILARKNEQFRDTLRTTLPFGDKIVEFTCSDVNTIFGRTVGTDDEDNLNAVYYSMLMGVIDRMKKSVNETIDKLFSKKSDQIFIEKRDDSNKPIPMDLAASNEPYKRK